MNLFQPRIALAAILLCAGFASSASAQLTITPITWDVVGLDHNRPLTSGPELFPVGAEVCSAVATTNVQVDLEWSDGNGNGWDFGPGDPYINARENSLTSLVFPSIGAGECVDAYFELRVVRSALAFGQSREYTIVATDLSGSVATPSPRQIYIEQLVSQSRNVTTQVRFGQLADESDWVTLGYGTPINLAIDNDYFIELTTETSTGYEELQSFLTLSNTIFQVLSVETTYGLLTAPPSRVPVPNPRLWADGCEWESDPLDPNYNSCLSTGKAGDQVVTTYEIRIISGGGDAVSLNALIYDRSGSSFHYNADYSPVGEGVTYDPTSAGFAKRFVPDTIGLGGTSRLRFTITNPNPIDISGYNFLDELPAGVLVASPASVTSTCGGTVTAVAGTDEIALAGGFVSANGTCSILVNVTAAAAGTYNNVSQNLFIGDIDTGNNATATLTVSATPPPVLVCDELATLALWQFPLAASATAPAPTSSVVTASAAAGPGLPPRVFIATQNNDAGGSWEADNISTGALNTANQEYFEFTIDTTGLDEITLDFASRRTTQGPQNLRLYYGPAAENASTVYTIGSASTWISQGPTTISSGLNPTGNTIFRIYAYNSTLNNNGHSVFLDGVRFRGLHCDEVTPPPPTPGVLAPTVSKAFSPTPIGVGHESTLTFTITNPNPGTALSGIAFTDELPSGVSVVAGSFAGTCTGFWSTDPDDSGVLVHSGGSLAAAGSCTLTVDVTSSTAGTALNVSDPIYSTQSGYNTNVTTGIAQSSLVVLASPTILKFFDPDLVLTGVTPGNASTLTFRVSNPNPNNAIGGVSFSDPLPAGLEVASPPNATTTDCGSPTWAPLAGATSLSFSGGSIPADTDCIVTVDITGPNGVYDNISNAVSHIVSGVPASNGDVAEGRLVIDDPIPGVSIRKEAGPGSDPDNDPWFASLATTSGEDVYYKITVENTGELPLIDLDVVDPDVDTSGCVWPNPLPVADVFDSHIATCVVGPVTAVLGTHVNTATAEADSTHGTVSDVDSAEYVAAPVADLAVTKTDGVASALVGDPLTYVLTVSNAGPDASGTGVTLVDTLPTNVTVNGGAAGAVTLGGANAANWSCTSDAGSPQEISCTTTVSIAASGSSVFSFTTDALVGSLAGSTVTNTATVTGAPGVVDPDPSDDTGTDDTSVVNCIVDADCNDSLFCTGTETCVAGNCQAGTDPCAGGPECADTCNETADNCFDIAGTSCGSGSDTICDNPDTCNGSGTCQANNEPNTTVCRADAGQCDAAETCDGAGSCPADAFEPNTTSCTGASQAGVCDNDAGDLCSGTSNTCVDAFAPNTTVCRADAGQCDVAETCTGSSGSCPADAFEPNTTSCTGASQGGVCDNDAADVCSGTANTCVDAFAPNTTVCRADAGECDVAETCTGSSGSCPADAFEVAGTSCGSGSDTVCDNPDTCDGSGSCQVNNEPNTTVCRADAGQCDVAETCDGAGSCPADAFEPNTTSCTGASQGGTCDNDAGDLCSGTANTCVDAFAPNTTVCRADAGQCDVAETCTGSSGSCPADAFEPNTTSCTGASQGGVCDNDAADVCSGTANTCVDAFAPNTTVCRADAGECDVAETCTGSSGSCPADAFEVAGTSCGSGSDTVCDNPDTCDGSGSCQVNNEPNTTVCRADAGQCDVAETCDGAGSCPADAFEPNTTSCTGASQGGTCDNDAGDLCSGTANTCVDAFAPNTTVCRADAGDCDIAETCTGSSGSCPADAFEVAGTSCGSNSDTVCDNPDTCNGSGTCQANNEPITVECRADAGQCDVAENCDGAGNCPADAFSPNTTACTGSSQGGVCDTDALDRCTGTSNSCVDAFAPNTTVCRADAGECDVAETCTGSSGSCPVDAFEIAGTSCGSGSDTACDNPDTCNGSGTCLLNNEANGTSCNDLQFCNGADTCTAGICVSAGDPCAPVGCDEIADICLAEADLSVTKTDLSDPVVQGSILVYSIQVSNAGPIDATNVTVTDTLDPSTTYQSDTGGCTEALGVLTCNVGTIPNGASTIFTVTVLVSPAAPTAGVLQVGACDGSEDICNSASVSGDQPDTNVGNDVDDEPTDVEVPAAVGLTLVKTDAPDPVTPGGSLVYTLTYSNTGSSTIANAELFETYDPRTTFVSSVPAPSSGDDTWSLGDLAPGETGVVTITMTVDGGLADGTVLDNVAVLTGDSTPSAIADEPTTVQVTGGGLAALAVTKSVSPTVVPSGALLTWTVTARNNGVATSYDTIVSDTLPAGLTYMNASPTPSLVLGNYVEWNAGDLPPGASRTYVVYAETSTSLPAGALVENCADAGGTDGPGTLPGSGLSAQGCATASVTGAGQDCRLVMTKRGVGIAQPGGEIVYRCLWCDPCVDAPTVVVIDDLPEELEFVSLSSRDIRGYQVLQNGTRQQVVLDVGQLPKGHAGIAHIRTRVKDYVLPGTIVNNDIMIQDAAGRVQSDTDVMVIGSGTLTDLGGQPTLRVTGSTRARAGGNVQYMARYSNLPAGSTAMVTLTDTVNPTYVTPAPTTRSVRSMVWKGLSGSGILKVKGKAIMDDPAARGGVVSVEAMVTGPDGSEVVKAGVDTAVLASTGGSTGGGTSGGGTTPAGSTGKASLTAPSFVRPGLTATVMLRYTKLVGASKASVTLPAGFVVQSTFPASASIVGNVVEWNGLSATSGILKLTVAIPETAKAGDSLTVAASVTDEAGTVGLERTLGVR